MQKKTDFSLVFEIKMLLNYLKCFEMVNKLNFPLDKIYFFIFIKLTN